MHCLHHSVRASIPYVDSLLATVALRIEQTMSTDVVSNQMVNQCALCQVMNISLSNISAVAAICFPEILKNVQAELGSVVGRDRMPTFDDERSLPYLVAFIKEVTRRVLLFYLSPFLC